MKLHQRKRGCRKFGRLSTWDRITILTSYTVCLRLRFPCMLEDYMGAPLLETMARLAIAYTHHSHEYTSHLRGEETPVPLQVHMSIGYRLSQNTRRCAQTSPRCLHISQLLHGKAYTLKQTQWQQSDMWAEKTSKHLLRNRLSTSSMSHNLMTYMYAMARCAASLSI